MAYRTTKDTSLTKIRSAVTNGRSLLTGIDQRSSQARRYKDVSDAIASDAGGYDALSETMLHLVRSAAGLVILRERLDAMVLNDQRIDVQEYCRISNSLRRMLATIGLKRLPRDVTPTVNAYINNNKGGRVRINHSDADDEEAFA